MQVPFFPGPVFGWIYVAILVAILGTAAGTDLRSFRVPKWLTVPALGLGVVVNVVRGAWLGSQGLAAWSLGAHGAWVGGLDGLLFSLAGFAVGFGLFLLMWILGVCGGGDVKLFAALGAWVGPALALCVLAVSVGVVLVLVFGRLAVSLVAGDWTKVQGKLLRGQARPRGGRGQPQPKSRLLGFSLPLAVAATVVLLWAFRVDLHFVPAAGGARAPGASHAH